MSDVIDQYRKMAARARSEAAATSLPNVRQLHVQSAERLDEIASGLESVAHAKVRNESAEREAAGYALVRSDVGRAAASRAHFSRNHAESPLRRQLKPRVG